VASKRQPHMTGMLGVYLVAAELSRLGFIVSPTSRSAAGADLLVTDQRCQKAWSVQVKTNRKAINYWLVGERARHIKSDSHVYVFVNLRGETVLNIPTVLSTSSFRVAMWPQKWRSTHPKAVRYGTHLCGLTDFPETKDGRYLVMRMLPQMPQTRLK
jgi:hypothetical protein